MIRFFFSRGFFFVPQNSKQKQLKNDENKSIDHKSNKVYVDAIERLNIDFVAWCVFFFFNLEASKPRWLA